MSRPLVRAGISVGETVPDGAGLVMQKFQLLLHKVLYRSLATFCNDPIAHLKKTTMNPSNTSRLALLACGAAALGLGTAHGALTLNFDINQAGSTSTYSGIGVAKDETNTVDTGTVWNGLDVTQNGTGYITIADVDDSGGNSTGVGISLDRDNGGTMKVFNSTSGGNPNPSDLMSDYAYWGGWTIALSGLATGDYDVYMFGHGNTAGGTSTWTLDASNGGGSASTTDTGDFRDIFQTNAEGNSFVVLSATVGVSGTLTVTGGDSLNGFQIIKVPEPSAALLGGLCLLGLLRRRRG